MGWLEAWITSMTQTQRLWVGWTLIAVGLYFMIVLAFTLYYKYKDKINIDLSDQEKKEGQQIQR